MRIIIALVLVIMMMDKSSKMINSKKGSNDTFQIFLISKCFENTLLSFINTFLHIIIVIKKNKIKDA